MIRPADVEGIVPRRVEVAGRHPLRALLYRVRLVVALAPVAALG